MLLLGVAAQCRAGRAQGIRVHGSEGFQGSGSVPSSLYSASSFLRAIRAPEAKHEQHTHRHPILWSWRATISPISDFHSPSGKVIAKVVGRLISHPNGRSPASHSPRLALERPLPGQLDVARYPTELRGRQRKDRLLRWVKHDANTGRQRLAAIPPRTRTQVVLTHTSAYEDADSIRHEAPFAKENVECSSALCPRQVERSVRICPPVRMVDWSPFRYLYSIRRSSPPHITNRLGRYSIFMPRWHDFLLL